MSPEIWEALLFLICTTILKIVRHLQDKVLLSIVFDWIYHSSCRTSFLALWLSKFSIVRIVTSLVELEHEDQLFSVGCVFPASSASIFIWWCVSRLKDGMQRVKGRNCTEAPIDIRQVLIVKCQGPLISSSLKLFGNYL